MPHANFLYALAIFPGSLLFARLFRAISRDNAHYASTAYPFTIPLTAFLALFCCFVPSAMAAGRAKGPQLAPNPPMGWNDWAHYQCGYTAQTILDNARALVKTGLAARGYKYVTIDDCWMQKSRDHDGNLQPNPKKFPHGITPVIRAVHALGLKFGIYEDSGFATCAGFAASGVGKNGEPAHFLQDAKLFAAWGVDYLKLDGCNLYVAKGESKIAAYRHAYKAESEALHKVRRPIVFLESAPAYFQGTPDWYKVLHWAGRYGQLWREGTDIETYNSKKPNRARFHSILWNYTYNLPLGRYQEPGNWNDADFIIGGDSGVTLSETRSQLALWSMMSSPLILSSNVSKLSPASIAILENRAVISIDQDPLGRMATLIRRTPTYDVLFKQLQGGNYAVAVLDRGTSPINITLRPSDLGFGGRNCRLTAQNLWTTAGAQITSTLHAHIASHDTAIWKVRPTSTCNDPTRTGTITRIIPNAKHDPESYTRCLASPGVVEACSGAPVEIWTVTHSGALQNAGKCLTAKSRTVRMEPCRPQAMQHWTYNVSGNLINRKDQLCLTGSRLLGLTLSSCGHNLASQIWSLPTALLRK